MCAQSLGHVRLFGTLWTVACQSLLSVMFAGKDELPFPPPGDLLDPGIKLESFASPALQADFYHSAIREAPTTPIDAYI